MRCLSDFLICRNGFRHFTSSLSAVHFVGQTAKKRPYWPLQHQDTLATELIQTIAYHFSPPIPKFTGQAPIV